MLHNTRPSSEELYQEIIEKGNKKASKLSIEILKDCDLPRVDAWFDPGTLKEIRNYNNIGTK